MRAFSRLGFEAADDLGGAADAEVRVAGGGEIGAKAARVGAGEITGAFVIDEDRNGLVVVWVIIFTREHGVDDDFVGGSFKHTLILRNADNVHRKRAWTFDGDFHISN